MKRLSKKQHNQFTLSLYREPPQQFDGPTREELLNVLADLLREALSEEIRTKEEQEENGHES